MALKQKLLFLCSASPSLESSIGSWAIYDGTGAENHTTGDSDAPPYTSVLHAMRDGWRVIQVPQLLPPQPGYELSTSYMKFEYVLEKLEEAQ